MVPELAPRGEQRVGELARAAPRRRTAPCSARPPRQPASSEHPPGGRRRLQHRRAASREQRRQRGAVEPRRRGDASTTRAPAVSGRQQLQPGDVEGQRGRRPAARRPRVEPGLALHGGEEVDAAPPCGICHPLGRPGRARGVDDVRQVVGRGPPPRAGRAPAPRRSPPSASQSSTARAPAPGRSAARRSCVTQHAAPAASSQHERQALLRVAPDRAARTPRPPSGCPAARRPAGRALQADADQRAGPAPRRRRWASWLARRSSSR